MTRGRSDAAAMIATPRLTVLLDADPPGALDAVHDIANMPPTEEPQRARDDLDTVNR